MWPFSKKPENGRAKREPEVQQGEQLQSQEEALRDIEVKLEEAEEVEESIEESQRNITRLSNILADRVQRLAARKCNCGKPNTCESH